MLDEDSGTEDQRPPGKELPTVTSSSLQAVRPDGPLEQWEPITELPKGVNVGDLYEPKPPGRLKQAFMNWAFQSAMPAVFTFLRTVAPVFPIPLPNANTTLLTRFDDVQEVFSRNKDFVVPYIGMAEPLRWDPTFVLAMKHDDEAYKRQIGFMRRLWLDADLDHITEIADRVSQTALDAHDGEIDAVQELMLPVVLHVLKDYYGMPMEGLKERDDETNNIRSYDKDSPEGKKIRRLKAFITGTNAIAGYVFGPQTHSDKKDRNIHWAANSVWPYLYDATNNYGENAPPDNTIIGRARRLRGKGEMDVTDAELRSIILGMIAGFLPTNTNANGKAFDVLMKNPKAKDEAQKIVDRINAIERDPNYAPDDEETKRILDENNNALLGIIYEAQRHQYILPGLWRMTEKDQLLRIGKKRQKKIKKGRLLYISGMSAMFDGRRVRKPKQFIGNRSRDTYLIYGHRFHYCIGAHLSDKMMLAMFKALFSRHAQYKQGEKAEFQGNIPWHIRITYDQSEKPAAAAASADTSLSQTFKEA